MPPKVGQVIHNKYRLLRHIGDGGMGAVYEARHETLGTTVALKFLHLEFSRREGLVQRFLQEARASARIQSPHVVRVADVDQTPDGDVFIVLEYLEGKTLQAHYEELYRAGRRLSYAEALDFADQMLDGVEAAHAAGIVHRDLKPDNVMITVDARGATLLKLLDFGIAKLKVIGAGAPVAMGETPRPPGLTRPGVMMGTPEYMAPEQASSADTVDARADIFSLGVIIFEMLGGQRPVGGDDPHDLATAYRNGQISQLTDLVPGIAPELAAAVHRAIAADPKGRFATASEMHDAVEPFASAVRPPSPSRLRAGGTIGVSEVSTSGLRAPPPAAPPPPTDGGPASGAVADGGARAGGAAAGNGAAKISGAIVRPSGVAKTWPPDEEPPPAPAPGTLVTMTPYAGGGLAQHDNPVATVPMVGHAGHDRTHRMDEPYASATAPRSMALPGPAAPARRRRRTGLTPAGIVVSAACVAGLVMGIIYLASRSSSKDRDDDPHPHTAAAPTTPTPPTPAEPPPPTPSEPPPFVAPPPGPTPPPAPRPGPSGQRPKPSPSATPSADPSAPSPGLFPFPFPNPFQPPPQAPGSGTPRQQDPPPLFPLP